MKGALLLLAAGALLSLVIFRGVSPSQLLATLEMQATVRSWDAEAARARLGDELLLVDGRTGGAGARPKDAFSVPFEERNEEVFVMPEGRQVRAALVVMEAARAAEARELAQWLAREWGLEEVATFRG
ncbi:MAG: hypothetical protein ACHQ1G_05390, partial [Planctomycetota bacterium]